MNQKSFVSKSNSLLPSNLRFLSQKKHVSQTELAKHCGLHKTQISRLFSGETMNPQISTILPIAKFFGITVEQLVDEEIYL